jgi:hypothetical protein
VAFRARFSACFSGKLPDFGPQDIEQGVVDSVPSQLVEELLCALLSLVLNRKKNVESVGHSTFTYSKRCDFTDFAAIIGEVTMAEHLKKPS